MNIQTRRSYLARHLAAAFLIGLMAVPLEGATLPANGEVVANAVAIRAKGERTAPRLSLAYQGDVLRVLSEEGEYYKVELPRDYTMWVNKDFVATGPDKEAVVTADGLQARAGAGLEYQASGMLDRGRRIEIVDKKDDWYRFRFVAGDTGYIARQYVKLAGEDAPRPGPPEKTEPSVKPEPGEDATVLDMFNRAEEMYQREVRKEKIAEWELDEAGALYEAVLQRTHDPKLSGECRRRLTVVALARRYREASRTSPVSPRERLAEREKEIEREFEIRREKIAEEIKRLFPRSIAVGRLEKLASNLQPITHKLMKDGRMTHLLYSDTVKLSAYEGQLVGIEGTVDKALRWPIPAIRVTGVVLTPKEEAPEKPETKEETKQPPE